MIRLSSVTVLALMVLACGDSESGGSGGAGGDGGGSTANTASGTTSGTTTTTTTATTVATSAATTAGQGGGGGQAAGHCDSAVHCNSVDGYYCSEVSGPSAAFETQCAAESGTFGQGACESFFNTGCLFDCSTPSVYSVIGTDQQECEAAGGTYFGG